MDRNGKFELTDSAGGTNFQIDANNDGKFWGKAEFHSTNEIVTLCGQNYLVSGLNNDRAEFTRTDLKLAKVDDPVPAFSFTLLDGRPVTDAALKGEVYVLDFWASWCIPCVKNLPHIVEFRDQNKDLVRVYSVNVDTARKRTSASEIIQKYGLAEFSTIRGLGDADPFWKTFGGANLNRLSIPLYVLVDKDGVVRYADNGGEGLIKLKQSIDKLLTK
jgi:thiol-disulfide isomerase/thioredoxin